MKIGILSERLLKGFGVDLVIHNQANGLSEKGHDVTVYVQRLDNTFQDQKYKVVEIDSPLFFNPVKTEFILLKRKLKFFRNEENDIWIIHSFPFFVLTPFLKGKVFIYDHGTVSSQGMYLKKKLVFLFQKYSSRLFYFAFANKVIAISEFIKKDLPFYIRAKTTVIYNGTNHYTQNYLERPELTEKMRKELEIGPDNFMLFYIGRLNHFEQPYKGVDDLIEIFKEVQDKNKNIKLVMAGFGSEEDKTYLESLGIKVLLNPPTSELLIALRLASLYVSATKWEGFNLPMVEAQSFGKIPIVYDIGPHSEILNSGIDSFVVKNRQEFVEKILMLYNDRDLLRRMSPIAVVNALGYTWKKAINNLNKLIEEQK